VDPRTARHAVTGVAADAVGLLGKMIFWMSIVWAFPGLLIVALVKGETLFAVTGTVFGAFGLLVWWISNGVIKRGKVRIILAALGFLGLAAASFSPLLIPASERPDNFIVLIPDAVLFALVGVLIIAETFKTVGKGDR